MPVKVSHRGATIELPTPEMRADLRRLERSETPIVRDAVTEWGEGVNSEAQYEAPIRTGFLKESHFVDASTADRGHAEVGATASYARVVHETHPTKSRWYLNAILKHSARILRKSIERAMARHSPRGGSA